MTPERGALWLFGIDAIINIAGFVFFGNFVFFFLGLLCLIFFYSFLEWEFERKAAREERMKVVDDAIMYGIGYSINGKHISAEDVYHSTSHVRGRMQ